MSDTSKIQVPDELIKWKELTEECAISAKKFYKKERKRLDNKKPSLEKSIADTQNAITTATNELCNSGFHFTETIRILPTVNFMGHYTQAVYPGKDYIELECCIFCKKILSAKKIRYYGKNDKVTLDGEVKYTLDGKLKYIFSELSENEYPDPSEYTIPEPNFPRLLATAKCYMDPDIKENFKLTPLNCKLLWEITRSLFNEEAIFDLYHVYDSYHINIHYLIGQLSRLIKLKEELSKFDRNEFYKHKELCSLFGHDIPTTLNTAFRYKCECCRDSMRAYDCLSDWKNAPFRGLVFPRPNFVEPLSDEQKAARRKQFYEGY